MNVSVVKYMAALVVLLLAMCCVIVQGHVSFKDGEENSAPEVDNTSDVVEQPEPEPTPSKVIDMRLQGLRSALITRFGQNSGGLVFGRIRKAFGRAAAGRSYDVYGMGGRFGRR